MHKSKGFTLIELMIVVAIIAILAAIAISRYKEYVDSQQAGGSGTQTSAAYSASSASSTLVCTDASGKEVKNIPAIPGQRWYFEGGSYVTTDANGNPVTESTTGLSCSVK